MLSGDALMTRSPRLLKATATARFAWRRSARTLGNTASASRSAVIPSGSPARLTASTASSAALSNVRGLVAYASASAVNRRAKPRSYWRYATNAAVAAAAATSANTAAARPSSRTNR